MGKFKEKPFGLYGKLSVYKLYPDGVRELWAEQEDNLIVYDGYAMALDALFPVSSGAAISYGKVGTGGATDPGGLFLKVPTPDMHDLYTPLARCSIIRSNRDVSTPSAPKITLLATLDNGDGNGSYINEAGYFSGDGYMFNIKTFNRILKTEDFAIQFEWVIGVV